MTSAISLVLYSTLWLIACHASQGNLSNCFYYFKLIVCILYSTKVISF